MKVAERIFLYINPKNITIAGIYIIYNIYIYIYIYIYYIYIYMYGTSFILYPNFWDKVLSKIQIINNIVHICNIYVYIYMYIFIYTCIYINIYMCTYIYFRS